ncbi:hypothetical protein EVAR_75233_1 [Eumeta japonica]|uniref:Uncharacterized protein n=1 Tax=Eumeta variegata TaxID=151549 RepID=A0A4C1V835_EUMVA|nr:hypothetical protein EVAR_75233_1 [Eumeta japonica]
MKCHNNESSRGSKIAEATEGRCQAKCSELREGSPESRKVHAFPDTRRAGAEATAPARRPAAAQIVHAAVRHISLAKSSTNKYSHNHWKHKISKKKKVTHLKEGRRGRSGRAGRGAALGAPGRAGVRGGADVGREGDGRARAARAARPHPPPRYLLDLIYLRLSTTSPFEREKEIGTSNKIDLRYDNVYSHDGVAKHIYRQRAPTHNLLNTHTPYYKYKPAKVLENSSAKLYRDRDAVTDRTILSN